MTSVLIPAYNEEAVVARTLKSVLESVGDQQVEILVVCNACKDDTANVARSVDSRVQVISTETPGKCNAINLGEQVLRTFPRIYLDADIQVSPTFVRDIANALNGPEPLGAWPMVRHDMSKVSLAVRAYYRVWKSMPYNQPGRIGVGAYAMNAAGRARFGKFPEIISDDGFARGIFPDPEERRVVETCYTVVQPPRDIASLIAVRTRSRMGVYQLKSKYPEVLAGNRTHRAVKGSSAALLHPLTVASMPIYAFVVWLTKRRARARLANSKSAWDRDLTTRS